jgi:hypothetical protein
MMSKVKQFPQIRGGQVNGKCGCGCDLFHLVMQNDYVLGIQCSGCGLYVENDSDDKSEFIVDVED